MKRLLAAYLAVKLITGAWLVWRIETRAAWVAEKCWITTGWRPPRRFTYPIVWTLWTESKGRGAEDVAYALMDNESGCNPQAVGYKERKERRTPISFGLYQPRLFVAKAVMGRRVGITELLGNPVINAKVGVRHLRNSKTIQAWSAGVEGCKTGQGQAQAKKTLRKLKRIPWVKRNRSGAIRADLYGKWFRPNPQRKHDRTQVVKKPQPHPPPRRVEAERKRDSGPL